MIDDDPEEVICFTMLASTSYWWTHANNKWKGCNYWEGHKDNSGFEAWCKNYLLITSLKMYLVNWGNVRTKGITIKGSWGLKFVNSKNINGKASQNSLLGVGKRGLQNK